MFDVIALGELLIDFAPNRAAPGGSPLFQANPGGAPCNVLAMLQKLDLNTAFIGKVGDDMFGRRLKKEIESAGVSSDMLVLDQSVNTTLAFVEFDDLGERSFSFYRNPGADMMLNSSEIRSEAFRGSRAFHFGTLSMTHEPAAQATIYAVECAKKAGALISFDPNIRPALWSSMGDARRKADYGCSVSDIVKIEQSELQFLMDCDDIECAADNFLERYKNVKLLTLTFGKNGSRAYCAGERAEEPSFSGLSTIDTTGAGDCFCACCLAYYLKYCAAGMDFERLHEMLTFANAAAGIVTTRLGALMAMPNVSEVERLIQESGR